MRVMTIGDQSKMLGTSHELFAAAFFALNGVERFSKGKKRKEPLPYFFSADVSSRTIAIFSDHEGYMEKKPLSL